MMIGTFYATGVTVKEDGAGKWSAEIKFQDQGFCQDRTTEGTLYTRYYVEDLALAIDTVLEDAAKMGIALRDSPLFGKPAIYYVGDGEWKDYPPPQNWKHTLREQAERIGFIAVVPDED